MEMLTSIVGGICVAYLVIAQILEALHHMELIKKRWPKAYKILLSPITRILLLIVTIGLFAEVLRERRQEAKHEPRVPTSTGPAVTTGDCSAANTGNNNKIDVNCKPQEPKISPTPPGK